MVCGMRKAVFSIPFVVVLLAVAVIADAQQPAKVSRIGYFQAPPFSAVVARTEAFLQGLRELGYVDGKNIVIEYRSAEGKSERVPALAAELVHLKVDVIVTGGSVLTRAAKKATSTIPIVIAQDIDPVSNGFVASLARPGGNITGLSTLAPEISGKRLELLKEILPKLSRVAVLGTSTQPGNAQQLKETELTAQAFRVTLQYLDVLSPKDIERAFRESSKGRADAVVMMVAGAVAAGSPNTDFRTRGKEPTADNVSAEYICRSRGAYELRRELYRLRPACRHLCG
jgi:putative ABC transport system substrate-binding protein